MPAKIEINNLTIALQGPRPVLSQVSLSLPAGKITSLIGPSGSGKSTLLRCLNRLWEPPPRTVFLDGQDITTLNVLHLRRRVGMLFQSAALFDGTVAQNIAYGPHLTGNTLSPADIEKFLTMAGLEAGLAQKPAGQLSGGQAQRVALARALANQPEVLLLDEPTSALDPAATHRVEETIVQLRNTLGLTVVWVSHDIEQVARTADAVVLLVDGRVEEIGDPGHLFNSGHHLAQAFAAGKL